MAADRPSIPSLACRPQRPRQADAEYHGKAPDLVPQHDPLADQLLAGDNQRANGVCRQRLHVHGLEEAGAGEMRQATRVVAVGLVGRQRLQRLRGLPALDTDNRHAAFG